MHERPTHCRIIAYAVPRRAVLLGLLTLAICLLALLSGPSVHAADPNKADTSRRARQDSIASIPFKKLDADARAKVKSVVDNTTFFRRMPVEVVDCDPNLYLFLIRHPEVIVEIWRYMGVTNLEIERFDAENFHAEDGAGSIGDVEFLYGDKNQHILYVTGSYDGSLLPSAIKAKCLLVLTCDYNQNVEGKYLITNRLDLFVDVENVGVDLLARTFHKMFGKTTDHNFVETAGFVSQISHTTEVNSPGMLRLVDKLNDLDPGVRGKFVRHIKATSARAKQRTVNVDARERARRTTNQTTEVQPARAISNRRSG